MDRKRKTKNPCPVCLMHLSRCICSLIPQLDLKTRLTLLIHHKELKRTTNTGQLAVHCLNNSSLHIRGLEHSPIGPLLDSNYQSLILFPSEGAVDIRSLRITQPIQLIVSDGNWRQASKAFDRHAELKNLTRVKVKAPIALYHLRKEHFEEGLSTLEAIAYALGAIEGLAVQNLLLGVYHAKLQATQIGRAGLIAQQINADTERSD